MNDKGKRPTALAMDLLIREILFSFFRLNATGERLFAGIGQTPGSEPDAQLDGTRSAKRRSDCPRTPGRATSGAADGG